MSYSTCVTPFVAVVAPRTGKIIKSGLSGEEKILYEMVYYILCLG